MNYRRAATILTNTWNSFQDFDDKDLEEIPEDATDAFTIALRKAYDVLIEKAKEAGEFYFQSAAIRIKDSETGTYLDFCGKRHHLILRDIREQGYIEDYKKWHKHGFMVFDTIFHELHFIDTETATQQAEAMGLDMISSAALTSEDLW